MPTSNPSTDRRIAPEPPTYAYWSPADYRRVHAACDGNIAAVARHYGIAYSTARRWQQRHGIDSGNGGGE